MLCTRIGAPLTCALFARKARVPSPSFAVVHPGVCAMEGILPVKRRQWLVCIKAQHWGLHLWRPFLPQVTQQGLLMRLVHAGALQP